MCRDHDSVHHTRWHIDFAYHWWLPDVGLVQFRPSPKLGGNDFLAGPEPFIVSIFQFVAGSLPRSKVRAGHEGCFLIRRGCNFSVGCHSGGAAAQDDGDKTNIDQFVKTFHSAFLLISSLASAFIV